MFFKLMGEVSPWGAASAASFTKKKNETRGGGDLSFHLSW
jgi:hypothetical protein